MQAKVNMTSTSGVIFFKLFKDSVALTKIEYRRHPAARHFRSCSTLYCAAPSNRVSPSYLTDDFSAA